MDAVLTQEEINHYFRRLNRLEEERKKGWEGHWRDLSRNFLPRRARFLDAGEPTNSGGEKNILETGLGIRALRILANGMQSGLTSPARPWFSLTLADKDLAGTAEAKHWLQDTYTKMVALFAQSNFYDQVHILYSELACFGTGVVVIEEDRRNVMRCRTLTVGEYALDAADDGRVDTLYRRIRMTPRQALQAWPDTCPEGIRDMAKRDSAQWLTILHAVEPNQETARRGSVKGSERPWRSVYIVYEGGNREVLEDSGYYEFPALCPRWVVTGSDIYGSSPAMDALADCRQLQKLTEDGRLALEMETTPPLLVASGHVNGPLDISPRAINETSSLAQGQEVVRPLVESRGTYRQGLAAEKAEMKDEIQRHFHNDLFLMISDANKQMTATEVAERNAEKLLMLGPVLDRLRSELFQPLIERVYGIMDRAGLIAFPPPVLAGQNIKVEFISILAQAQKQAGLTAIDQLVTRAGQLAQLKQSHEPLEKLNTDVIIETYADLLGTPPNVLLSEDELAALREQRRQQQMMMQQMAMLRQGAEIADKGAKAISNVMPGSAEQAAVTAALPQGREIPQ